MTRGRGPVQLLPDGVLELRHLHDGVRLRDADPVAEVADRGGRTTASAQRGERRHARVVPAGDVASFHQLEQLPLAQDGVRQVEAGEFSLPGGILEIECLQVPVVQRPVILELQGAERVRDPFERVRQRVSEVVGRIDHPVVAGAVVRAAADPVDGRIAHVHVPCRHVDLRA